MRLNASLGVLSAASLRSLARATFGRRLERRQTTLAYALVAPSLLLLLAVMVYPTIYTLVLSLHTRILSRPSLGMPFVGLGNYVRAVRDPLFRDVLSQTVSFVVVSVGIELVLGVGLALLLHQEFRCRNLVRGLVLLPWMLSPVVAAFSWAWLLNDAYGLVNYLLRQAHLIAGPVAWLGTEGLAMTSIVLVDVWREVPFVGVVLLAGLQSIPVEVHEAARIDGASRLRAFLHVTLPLLKPSIMIALLMRTMVAVRVFELPFIMTRGGPGSSTEMLATYTYKEAFQNFNMGYASGLAVVILLVSLVISLLYIRLMYSESALR